MTPEFSRIERADAIGAEPRMVEIAADAVERATLAARFGLISVDQLEARLTLHRDAAGIVAAGQVVAAVVQRCAVTDEPLPARVDEAIALRLVDPGDADENEVELGGEAIDTIEIEDGVVDLGEIAAETMALALDPFPRAPAADAALRDAGVLSEGEAGPFAALAALRDKLV